MVKTWYTICHFAMAPFFGGTSKIVIHPILGILTMATQKNIYRKIPDNHLIGTTIKRCHGT